MALVVRVVGMTAPDLRFTPQHEWLQVRDDGTFRVGITDFAQDSLGDIVFVGLPTVGTVVSAGGPLGEVESTKSVSEVYAPLSGVVVAVNDAVETAPETINDDPYGSGWLLEIKPEGEVDVETFLTEAAYLELVGG